MHSPFESLSFIILSRPKLVALIFLALIGIALYGTTLITMETGRETYLDKDTQRGMLLERYIKAFQSDSVMILIEADNVLDPDVLAYMERLQDNLVRERYVTGVSGIATMVKNLNGGILPKNKAEIQRIKEQIPQEILVRYVPSGCLTNP
jgi:predicted RND superfamily exporter protein